MALATTPAGWRWHHSDSHTSPRLAWSVETADCNLYARSIGLCGSCPDCDTVILLAELLEVVRLEPLALERLKRLRAVRD